MVCKILGKSEPQFEVQLKGDNKDFQLSSLSGEAWCSQIRS